MCCKANVRFVTGGAVSKLGISVRLARQESGLSQVELAELVGCRRTTVLHWEKGHHLPLPLYLRQLEHILGKKFDDVGVHKMESASS